MSAAKARFTVVFATKRLLLKEQLWSLTNVSSKGVTMVMTMMSTSMEKSQTSRFEL